MKARGLIGLLAILITGAAVVWAKGPPQKVTISGGALAGEVAYTDDPATLEAVGMMALEDYTTRSAAPPADVSGDGYLLTRFYLVQNGFAKGSYVPFDQVRYYPNPDGGRGYLNYVGIVGGSSEYDGQWFRPTTEGEAALQSLIVSGEQAQLVTRTAFRRVLALFGS